MKIYTKTGDKGETSLLGGKRVSKNCVEMRAIGEVDELNAMLGMLVAQFPPEFTDQKDRLVAAQHKLFTIGSNLAAVQTELINVPKLLIADIEMLESWIDKLTSELSELTQFILPGGSLLGSYCFYARALCRRAERQIVGLSHHYEIDPFLGQYINRLSDVLFTLGRWINQKQGIPDVAWQK